jgi:NAD(P)-dependent dehydrogenase (short-subunit alcohol dehydrogenase family)
MGLYGAAKAGLERLVRAAAFEFGSAGIRINAVRPGMTVPKETLENPASAAGYEAIAKETPLGRVGVPEDVARVVRFLAGPESGWVTGQCFSVDGGQEQGKMPDMMDALYGKERMDKIRAGKPIELTRQIPKAMSTSLTPPKS